MKNLIFFALLILLLPKPILASEKPSVIINEIAWMGTMASANAEWIELYNTTSQDIDLTDWILFADDNSPVIILEGIIEANGFFILERTSDNSLPNITADQIYSGALGNNGEWLKLIDTDDLTIDEINTLDGWPAGDNTTKQTLERSEGLSWHTSTESGGTPKSSNSQPTITDDKETDNTSPINDKSNDQSSTENNSTQSVKKGDIVINELFPNPKGPDLEQEFIELKNNGLGAINLTGWTLENNAGQKFTLPAMIMWPNSIVTFYRTQTNIVLNNLKDKITLKDSTGKIINILSYQSNAPEEKSYQKINFDSWGWAEITPGQDSQKANLKLPKAIIHYPKTGKVGEIILFDASDSYDLNNQPLSFTWLFSDGVILNGSEIRRVFTQAGKYTIDLIISADQQASTTESFAININSNILQKNIYENEEVSEKLEESKDQPPINKNLTNNENQQMNQPSELPLIFISEFLPYTSGPDADEEFIELFSQHDYPFDLSGYKIDDTEGGSRPFIIPTNTIINPGEYLLFPRPQTKIALNNSGGDEVRFLTPQNEVIDAVYYEETQKGFSYIRLPDFDWDLTETPTPGEINSFNQPHDNSTDTASSTTAIAQPKILGAETTDEPVTNSAKNKKRYIASGLIILLIVLFGVSWKIFQRFKK